METLEQSGRNESWARGWLETASRPPGSRRSTTHRSTQRPSPPCTVHGMTVCLSRLRFRAILRTSPVTTCLCSRPFHPHHPAPRLAGRKPSQPLSRPRGKTICWLPKFEQKASSAAQVVNCSRLVAQPAVQLQPPSECSSLRPASSDAVAPDVSGLRATDGNGHEMDSPLCADPSCSDAPPSNIEQLERCFRHWRQTAGAQRQGTESYATER